MVAPFDNLLEPEPIASKEELRFLGRKEIRPSWTGLIKLGRDRRLRKKYWNGSVHCESFGG